MEDYNILDLKRIFLGSRSLVFLVEIILRTIIMYSYAIFLLRLFGKRGMGQFSNLELAIIISFGSAVGDPMIGAEMPIVYGLVCITTVALLQIGMEMVINKNPRLERIMEGKAVCLVRDGRIDIRALHRENLSVEDLFRKLRTQHITHLGEVEKAFFETSGEMTVVRYSSEKSRCGLSVLPEPLHVYHNTTVNQKGIYSCTACGFTRTFEREEHFPSCSCCASTGWVHAKK